MGISDITSLIEKYGISGSIFVFALLAISTMIKSQWFSTVLSKISDKFIERFMKDKTKNIETQFLHRISLKGLCHQILQIIRRSKTINMYFLVDL